MQVERGGSFAFFSRRSTVIAQSTYDAIPEDAVPADTAAIDARKHRYDWALEALDNGWRQRAALAASRHMHRILGDLAPCVACTRASGARARTRALSSRVRLKVPRLESAKRSTRGQTGCPSHYHTGVFFPPKIRSTKV